MAKQSEPKTESISKLLQLKKVDEEVATTDLTLSVQVLISISALILIKEWLGIVHLVVVPQLVSHRTLTTEQEQ